ncbi:Uncharacterised protein g2901 [Pycnogonum litorale]
MDHNVDAKTFCRRIMDISHVKITPEGSQTGSGTTGVISRGGNLRKHLLVNRIIEKATHALKSDSVPCSQNEFYNQVIRNTVHHIVTENVIDEGNATTFDSREDIDDEIKSLEFECDKLNINVQDLRDDCEAIENDLLSLSEEIPRMYIEPSNPRYIKDITNVRMKRKLTDNDVSDPANDTQPLNKRIRLSCNFNDTNSSTDVEKATHALKSDSVPCSQNEFYNQVIRNTVHHIVTENVIDEGNATTFDSRENIDDEIKPLKFECDKLNINVVHDLRDDCEAIENDLLSLSEEISRMYIEPSNPRYIKDITNVRMKRKLTDNDVSDPANDTQSLNKRIRLSCYLSDTNSSTDVEKVSSMLTSYFQGQLVLGLQMMLAVISQTV